MLYIFGVRRRLIKGEELPHRGGAAGNHARMFIEGEGVIRFIEYSVILPAIVIVVAVFVHLEKPLDVGEARFSLAFHLGVKQVGQGFSAIPALHGLMQAAIPCIEFIEHRIAALQVLLHDTGVWLFWGSFHTVVASPFVPIARIEVRIITGDKEERMTLIDALGIILIFIYVDPGNALIRIRASRHPIVKEVDGRPRRGDAGDDVLGVGRDTFRDGQFIIIGLRAAQTEGYLQGRGGIGEGIGGIRQIRLQEIVAAGGTISGDGGEIPSNCQRRHCVIVHARRNFSRQKTLQRRSADGIGRADARNIHAPTAVRFLGQKSLGIAPLPVHYAVGTARLGIDAHARLRRIHITACLIMDVGTGLTLHRFSIAAGIIVDMGAGLFRLSRLVSTACHMVNHTVTIEVSAALVAGYRFPGFHVAASRVMDMGAGLPRHRLHIATSRIMDVRTGSLPCFYIIAALRRMLWMMDAKAILCRKR